MEKKPKVLVVMSTYNGEKFLKEQIDSILAQEKVEVVLHIFDDCSKDSTVKLASEYVENNQNVFLHVNEKNKNFTYNFLDGLFEFKDNQDYDYYAFADQDDFWAQNKLISAINKIKEIGECTLYSSNLTLVDGELNPLNKTMLDMFRIKGDYNFKKHDEITRNIVTGCTMVFDNKFKNLVTQKYPENIYLHDYWIALIANYVDGAHFIYDNCPDYILYRQHGNNLIGAKKTSFIRRIGRFLLKKDNFTLNYFKSFYNFYEKDLRESDRIIIDKLINYKKLGNRKYIIKNIETNYKKGITRTLYLNKLK